MQRHGAVTAAGFKFKETLAIKLKYCVFVTVCIHQHIDYIHQFIYQIISILRVDKTRRAENNLHRTLNSVSVKGILLVIFLIKI